MLASQDDALTVGGFKPAIESKIELELILMIVSDDPASLVKKISGLTSIAEYRLISRPARMLRDVYLDTHDRLLGRRRINLRVRGAEGNYWITMKISPRLLSMKRQEREETEVQWSQASLNHLLAELGRKGIRLKSCEIDDRLSPAENLKHVGLEVLQDRETYREPKDIVRADSTGEVIAELVIDSVLYHLPGLDVRTFEIEVEAKSQTGRRIIGKVTEELQRVFGPELRTWRFGKLVTGKKIERMWRGGTLQAFLNGTSLRPEAFNVIERA